MVAEKLLKNVSDPTQVNKLLKTLTKSGVTNDTIKQFINSSDEAVYWLTNKSSLGLTDELLQAFMKHGDEYLSYSDDLIVQMSKSNGLLDDMIDMVAKHGDEAFEFVFVKMAIYFYTNIC